MRSLTAQQKATAEYEFDLWSDVIGPQLEALDDDTLMDLAACFTMAYTNHTKGVFLLQKLEFDPKILALFESIAQADRAFHRRSFFWHVVKVMAETIFKERYPTPALLNIYFTDRVADPNRDPRNWEWGEREYFA
jgi:hypothetical protein